MVMLATQRWLQPSSTPNMITTIISLLTILLTTLLIHTNINVNHVAAQSLSTIVPFSTEAIGNTIWYAGSAYASSRSRATDGPRNTAKFGILADITCVPDTTLCFIADTTSSSIRVMDITDGLEGIVSSLTPPGSIISPSFIVESGTDKLYVGDLYTQSIKVVSRRTGAITSLIGRSGNSGCDGGSTVAIFKQPYAACMGADNTTLYLVDRASNNIRRIAISANGQSATSTLFAGSYSYSGLTDSSNSLSARFNAPSACAYDDTNKRLFISDTGNNLIRVIQITSATDPTQNRVSTFAGYPSNCNPGFVNGAALSARFNGPTGIAWSSVNQVLFVTDSRNHAIRQIKGGQVTTLAGTPQVRGCSNQGQQSLFDTPLALSKKWDHLFVVEYDSGRVRRVAIQIEVIPSPAAPIGLIQGRPAAITWSLTRKCQASATIGMTTPALNVYFPAATTISTVYATNTVSNVISTAIPFGATVKDTTIVLTASGSCRDQGYMGGLDTFPVRAFAVPNTPWPPPFNYYSIIDFPTQLYSGEVMTQAGMWIPSLPLADIIVTVATSNGGTFAPNTFTYGITSGHITQRIPFVFTAPTTAVTITTQLTASDTGPAGDYYGAAGAQTITILAQRVITVTNMPTAINAGEQFVVTFNIGAAPARQSLTMDFTVKSPSSLVTISPSTYTFTQGSSPSMSLTITGASLLDVGVGTLNVTLSGVDVAGYKWYTGRGGFTFNTMAVRYVTLSLGNINFVPGMNATLTLTPSKLPTSTSMTVTPIAASHPTITFSPPVVTFVKNGVTFQTVVVMVPAGLTIPPATGTITTAFGGAEGAQYVKQVPLTLSYTLLQPSLIIVPATIDDTWPGLKSATMKVAMGRLPIYKSVTITPSTGVAGAVFTPSSVTFSPTGSASSVNASFYFTLPSSAAASSGNEVAWTITGGEAIGYQQPVSKTLYNILGASNAWNVSVEPWPALVADGTAYKNMKLTLSQKTPSALYVYFAATCIDMKISPYPVVVAANANSATFTVWVEHNSQSSLQSTASLSSTLTSSATLSSSAPSSDANEDDNDDGAANMIMIDNAEGMAPSVSMGRHLLATQDGVGGNLVGLKCFSMVTLTLGGTSATKFRPPSPYNVTIYHRGYFNWTKTTKIVSGTKQNFTVAISRLPLQVGQSVSVTIDIVSYGRWIWWNWFFWWSWCWRREPSPLTVSRTTLTWNYGGNPVQSFILGADTNDAAGDRYWEMYFSVVYSSSSSSASWDYRLGKHSQTDYDGNGDHDGEDTFWWGNMWYESVAFINILRRTTAVYPYLTSIQFSDQATSLIASFDIPTTIPGTSQTSTFPSSVSSCDVLIDLTTSTSPYIAYLGTAPTCQWNSEQVLEIILGSGATVVPGSVIAFRGGVIGNRASPTVLSPVAAVTGTVQGPVNPTPPTVVLITVSSVGLCSDVFLDARQSTGLLRGFGNYTWTVASVDSVGVPSLPALQALLTVSYSLASFTIPAELLAINGTYIFTVTVTNFLGVTSSASTKVVHKYGVPLPTLLVSGPLTIPQASTITIYTQLGFPPCVSVTTTWRYEWSMVADPVASTTNPPNGVPDRDLIGFYLSTVSMATLSIPGNVLLAGWIYTIQVAVSSQDTTAQGSVTDSVTFEVTPSTLAAVITGGNPLTSTLFPFVLDASTSSDPDDAPATTAASPSPDTWDFNSPSFTDAMANAKEAVDAGVTSDMTNEINDRQLTYEWGCALIPTINWNDLNTDCGATWHSLRNNTVTMALPAGTLTPGRKYTFTVTVSSALFNRSSSASIIVTTDTVPADLSTLIQVLQVSVASSSTQAGIASVLFPQVPPGSLASHESLRLMGTVNLLRGNMDDTYYVYTWSELGGLDVNALRISQPNTPSLVLPPNTLKPGHSYTFRLTVDSISTKTGEIIATSYSDIVRQTSTAPVSDSSIPVSVSPSTGGTALSTLFTFTAGGFSGDLEPFTYTFKLIQSNGIEVILGAPYQYLPSVTDYLPACDGGECTIAVEVMNLIGETTRMVTKVPVGAIPNVPAASVTPSPLSFDFVTTAVSSEASSISDATTVAINAMNGILAAAQRASSPDMTLTSIRLIADVLNDAPVTLTTDHATVNARVMLRQQLIETVLTYADTVDVQQVSQTLYALTGGSPLETSNATITVAFQLISATIDDLISEEIIYSGNSTSLLTSALSNLLDAAETCNQVSRISTLANRLIDVLLWDAIAGEAAGMIVTANIAIAALRTFSSVAITPQLIQHPGGMNLELPVEVTSTIDGDWADVHMISYATWTRVPFCYAEMWANSTVVVDSGAPNMQIASPITAVSILDWWSRPMVVSGLVNSIALNQSLPNFNSDTMQCSYINRDTNEWSTDGCHTVTSTGSSVVSCQCHQLVEFAVWATPADIIPVVETTEQIAVYAVYGFFYAIAASTAGVQLVRIGYHKRSMKFDATVVQHVLVLVIALFYSITSFMRARLGWSSLNIERESFAGIGLMMAIPYLIQFIVFTVLVADWTSMYHIILQNRGASPFSKLRVPFVIANLVIALFIFALFGGLGGTSDDGQAKQIAVAATTLIFVITLVMVVLYVAYGRRLMATVALPVGASVDTAIDGLHTKVVQVKRFFMATVAFSGCLVLQSLLWLISYASMASFYSNGTGILVLFYTVNLCSLALILAIFGKGIRASSVKEPPSTPASPAAAVAAAARKSVKFEIDHGTPEVDRSRAHNESLTESPTSPTSPTSPMTALHEPLAPTSPTPLVPPPPPPRPPRGTVSGATGTGAGANPPTHLTVTIADPDQPDMSVSPEVASAAAAMTAAIAAESKAQMAHARRKSTMTGTTPRRPVRKSFVHLADDSPPSGELPAGLSKTVVASNSFDSHPTITVSSPKGSAITKGSGELKVTISHEHHPVDLHSPIIMALPRSPKPGGRKFPPPLPSSGTATTTAGSGTGTGLTPPTPGSSGAGRFASPKTPAKKSGMLPPPLPTNKMGPPPLPIHTAVTPRGAAGLTIATAATTPRAGASSATPRAGGTNATPRTGPPPLPGSARGGPPPLPTTAPPPLPSAQPAAAATVPHRRTSTIGNIISSLRRPTRSSFVSLGQSDDLARMVQNERDEQAAAAAAAEAEAAAAANDHDDSNNDDTNNIHVTIG